MGSAASTHVNAIQEPERPKSFKVKINDAAVQSSCSDKWNEGKCSPKHSAENLQLDNALNNVKRLEKMLSESESRRLDLEDRVESLQDSVVELTATASTEAINQEMIQAKDEQITQLQTEIQELKKQFLQLKLNHKRRIKKLTARITEAKQEMSIQDFELKSEREKLSEENLQLKQKLRTFDSEGTVPSGDHRRMDLVIELSGQVSEQSEQISRLEKVIKEKDRIIQRLDQTQGTHTSGIDSFTSLDSESDGCHVNRLVNTSKPIPSTVCHDCYSGPVLEEFEQRWQYGFSDFGKQIEDKGKKLEEHEDRWKCSNGGNGKQSDDKGMKVNSQSNTSNTLNSVREKLGYFGDSDVSFLSDSSDSDIGFDSEWSQSKIRSAPPQYNAAQNKHFQAAQSNKSKVIYQENSSTVLPLRAFGEDSFCDGLNTDLGTETTLFR